MTAEDSRKIDIGRARLWNVGIDHGFKARAGMVYDLASRLQARGWEPTLDVIWHTAGSVTAEEWSAAVERGRAAGWVSP